MRISSLERACFLLSFCFFLIFLPMGHLPSDTEYSVATALSICEGRLSVEPSPGLVHLKKGRNGLYFSKYGIAYAVLLTPAAAASKILAPILPVDHKHLLYGLAACTNTFLAALIIMLFAMIFKTMGYSGRVTLLSVAAISVGSILLPYSKINHAEIPTTVFLLMFFLRLLSVEKLTFKDGNIFGIISSVLILFKSGNAVYSFIIIAFGVYLIIRGKFTFTGASALFLWPAAAVLILCGLNLYRFGNIFNTGYGGEQYLFTTPLFTGLWGLLFSPSKALLIFSPLSVLCIVSIYSVSKRFKSIAVAAVLMIGGNLLFYSKWHDWHGGWCWGPRLIVPAIILLHLFLPEFLDRMKQSNVQKSIFVLLLAAAATVNITGALVWYQQIHYFHSDYRTISGSHLVIAEKLLVNKVQGKPEVYTCSEFSNGCPGSSIWSDLINEGKIDFNSFETFQGFSTMWSGLSRNYHLGFLWIIPLALILFVLAGGTVLWKKLLTKQ